MDKTAIDTAADDRSRARRRARFGLSGKLLVLTILFVMIAEVLIYVPSIANFRLNWLRDRLVRRLYRRAGAGGGAGAWCRSSLTRQMLDSDRRARRRHEDGPAAPAADGLRHAAGGRPRHRHARRVAGTAPSSTPSRRLLSTDNDVMRVVGPAPMGGEFVEIVLGREAAARRRCCASRSNILLLSLIISAITATLVYFALHYLFVRPLRRITANMTAFRDEPENPARIIVASGAAGRDRHRRARARRHAARPRHAAAAEDPPRGARARGVEDQPRPAQPAHLGAAVLRPALEPRRTSRCSASRPS